MEWQLTDRLRQTLILTGHIVDSANGATVTEHTQGCLAGRLRRVTLRDNLDNLDLRKAPPQQGAKSSFAILPAAVRQIARDNRDSGSGFPLQTSAENKAGELTRSAIVAADICRTHICVQIRNKCNYRY